MSGLLLLAYLIPTNPLESCSLSMWEVLPIPFFAFWKSNWFLVKCTNDVLFLWHKHTIFWLLKSRSGYLFSWVHLLQARSRSLAVSDTHTHTHLGSHLSSLVKATDSYFQAFTCSLPQGSTGRWSDVGTVQMPSRWSSLNNLSRYRRYKDTSIYLQTTSWTTSINLDSRKWLLTST